MSPSRLPLVLLTLCGLAVGCGPIRSTAGIIEAEKLVKQVHETGADARLPYPATLADELLQAARDAQGYADYETSYLLAVEAKERAQETLNRAAAGESWRPPPAAPEAGGQAPEPAATPAAEPTPAPPTERSATPPGDGATPDVPPAAGDGSQ